MALIFNDHQTPSYFHDSRSEKMHNSPNIDLVLECEDDQSYALPRPAHVSNGVQIHASNNVSMRISFSPSVAPQNLTCRYCQCNFLSEVHFMNHMQQFHDDNDSGEEDGDDTVNDVQVASEGSVIDNDSVDSGYVGLFSIRKTSTKEESGAVVKTKATGPGNMKAAVTAAINGMATAAVHNLATSMATANVPNQGSGMATAAVPSQAKNISSFTARHPKLSPTVPENGVPDLKNIRRKSVSNEMCPNPRPPTENGAAEPKSLKRKSVSEETNPNPRLTLTIKKSNSSYEIQRDEHALDPVSPGMQRGEGNCDVQSDSANETIDVESSSPYSSPNSVKNDMPTVISGKKKPTGRFVCPQCERDYVSKYALKRHTATHSDARPFVCPMAGCAGTFKLKSRLSDHLRYVHKQKTPRTGNRSRPVPDATSSPIAQALHSPATASPAPLSGKPSAKTKLLKCPFDNCNREFRDRFNLNSHISLHTGQMSFACSVAECSFTTIQKASLDWHMQKMHAQS